MHAYLDTDQYIHSVVFGRASLMSTLWQDMVSDDVRPSFEIFKVAKRLSAL